MKKEPSFKELLAHINSAAENQKANCVFGLFVSEYYDENVKELKNLTIKKPIINISSFIEENEVYYNVEFRFKSYNDADFKQMWKFICNYCETAQHERFLAGNGEKLDKVTLLSLSILPDLYKGKYYIYINMPLLETISCTTNAFDKTTVISILCTDESLNALVADEDVIDRRSIEREVEQGILAEQEAEGTI